MQKRSPVALKLISVVTHSTYKCARMGIGDVVGHKKSAKPVGSSGEIPKFLLGKPSLYPGLL